MFLNKINSYQILRSINSQLIFRNIPQSCLCSQNVDKKDVENHAKLANDWWKLDGGTMALHALNGIRVPLIRDGLISTGKVNKSVQNTTNVLQGLEILEVGCGGGILTEPLARLNGNITGIDAGDDVISIAREHLKEKSSELISRITYKKQLIEDHCKEYPEKYDAVVVSEVIEHIVNKKSFLSSCVDCLKPGGLIFITTFNKTNCSYFGGIIMAENILRIVPKNTHDWNSFISPLEAQRLLEQFGCTTTLVNGIIYEFWKNSFKFVETTELHYALQAIKN